MQHDLKQKSKQEEEDRKKKRDEERGGSEGGSQHENRREPGRGRTSRREKGLASPPVRGSAVTRGEGDLG